MNDKLATVIILTYRSFKGIYATLESVLHQDYPQIEIVISDDGSPNYSEYKDGIESYIEQNRGLNIVSVTYNILKQNMGTVKNINSALKASQGQYIKILSSDDELYGTGALTKYISFLQDTQFDICFSKLRGVRPDGSFVSVLASCEDDYDLLRKLTPIQMRDRLFSRNCLPAPAWCVNRRLFDKYGYFHEDTRLIEDYSYWIYLCSQGVKFGFIDDILVNYKLSGVSSAGEYGIAFMNDLQIIYDKYIFPLDSRFGVFQPFYNLLKRAGLATYRAKANWGNYGMVKKIGIYIFLFPFFIYIDYGNRKIDKMNRKGTR